ncbi:MAG: Asp-tRNA(Asn)/Glu-tRNA(Gln) amidotransferase subunit GatA [Patescibacteria group bacterium]
MFSNLTISQAADLLASGKATSLDLTNYYLNRIEKLDPEIGAYLLVTQEYAREKATASDERRKTGKSLGILDGIPFGVKDVISTKDIETTAASLVLKGYVPPYSATVITKLEAAGAVILGKLNCDEFAMGSSTENSAYKITKNPWDTTKVPGGSSGGSAAALAADLCVFALGTDTGGSIRQPASFCSVTGIKPTYGRVSRFGALPYGSSLDQIGPMAKNIADLGILLEVMAGYDINDATTVKHEFVRDSETQNLNGIKLGLPKEYFAQGLEPEVKKIIDAAVTKYKELGAEIVPVSLPHTRYAIPTYYLIAMAEMSSNLARYDGIHYGASVLRDKQEQVTSLLDVYTKTRSQFFGAEAKRKIILGTFELSAGYYDAYYKKAQQVRTLIKKDFDDALEKVDALITPVSPFPPFGIGEKKSDPLSMYLADIYTVPANLAGVCALSLPAGFTHDGLPVGMQIIGARFNEGKILSIADVYEKATQWHSRFPEL